MIVNAFCFQSGTIMNRSIRALLAGGAFSALLLVNTQASAAPPQSALDVFKTEAFGQFTLCRLAAMVEVQKLLASDFKDSEPTSIGQAQTTVSACTKTAKKTIHPYFAGALKQLNKKKPAADALKDYFVAWTVALNNLPPLHNDTEGGYYKRTGEEKRKFDDLWERVILEASL